MHATRRRQRSRACVSRKPLEYFARQLCTRTARGSHKMHTNIQPTHKKKQHATRSTRAGYALSICVDERLRRHEKSRARKLAPTKLTQFVRVHTGQRSKLNWPRFSNPHTPHRWLRRQRAHYRIVHIVDERTVMLLGVGTLGPCVWCLNVPSSPHTFTHTQTDGIAYDSHPLCSAS